MPDTTSVLISSPDHTGTHPDAEIVTVEMPAGYRRVWRGALKPGDLYLYGIGGGESRWEPVTDFPTSGPYSTADWGWGCVARRDAGEVDLACERCGVEPRHDRNRYCIGCCADVVQQLRKSEVDR